MANTTCFRQIGPTVALSVGATAHAAVIIASGTNDQCNFATFLNTGTTIVAVNVAPSNAPAAVLPIDGVPQTVIVLPANMTAPLAYAVPTAPFSVSAIGSGVGPSVVYITPVGDQS
jgi:hypothetical protein